MDDSSGIAFADFIRGPGGSMCRELGLHAKSWADLRRIGQADEDRVIERAHEVDGAVSEGDRVLLQAVLAAAGIAYHADDLAACEAWTRIDDLGHPQTRLAVAATIARLP